MHRLRDGRGWKTKCPHLHDTACRVPRVEVEKLIDQYHDIERLYRGFIEHSLIESQVKADALRFEPAHERYNRLLQLHPEILKRAPLVYIASLLQMTPETLSRVRSSLL